ncbi:hypothetical protein AVEN_95028-1, partial [Araneus ventricosus]
NHPGKNRCPVFWDTKGVILIDFHTSGTINAHPHQTEVRHSTPETWAFESRGFVFGDNTIPSTARNIFVAWDGKDWITLPTTPILQHQT